MTQSDLEIATVINNFTSINLSVNVYTNRDSDLILQEHYHTSMW